MSLFRSKKKVKKWKNEKGACGWHELGCAEGEEENSCRLGKE